MNRSPQETAENARRMRRFYRHNPQVNSHEDRMRMIRTGSDEFIMEKVERWEKEQGLSPHIEY